MCFASFCSNPDPDWDAMFTFPNGTQGDPAGVDWIPDGTRYTIEIAVVQEQHYGNYTISPHNQFGQAPEPAVFMVQTRGTATYLNLFKTYYVLILLVVLVSIGIYLQRCTLQQPIKHRQFQFLCVNRCISVYLFYF